MVRVVAQPEHATPGYMVVYPEPRQGGEQADARLVVADPARLGRADADPDDRRLVQAAGTQAASTSSGALLYVIIAFYIARWARGLLPIAAALAILLLILAVIAGTGLAGTSWFDRNHFGFAPPQRCSAARA